MLPEIKFAKKQRSKWFDPFRRIPIEGEIHAFIVKSKTSGEWVLNVNIADDGFIFVKAVTSSGTSFIHEQIKRKSITFSQTSDRKQVYNMIGIGYIERDRFHYKRIENTSEIPNEIGNNFEITKHGDVAGDSIFREKLVALTNSNKPEKMALLFYLTKIAPINWE